jgi:2-keto-4-pentenoate hydratase
MTGLKRSAVHSRRRDNRKPSRISGLTASGRVRRPHGVQTAAIDAYGGNSFGYAVQATGALSRRQLWCEQPFFGSILDLEVTRSGGRFRLPRGVLGAGCSFAFVIGRPYPDEGEEIDRDDVFDAVAEYRPAIDILGRRVPGSALLNTLTATADFALSVLHVLGSHVQEAAADLAAIEVTARIDGNIVGRGTGRDVMGHPLEPVVWLARELRARGRRLEAGDIITTGSCLGILQLTPGELFEADFGPLGGVGVELE